MLDATEIHRTRTARFHVEPGKGKPTLPARSACERIALGQNPCARWRFGLVSEAFTRRGLVIRAALNKY